MTQQWHDYFLVRLADGQGYYVAYKGTKSNVFLNIYFNDSIAAREEIKKRWRDVLSETFEREILGGSKQGEAVDTTED